MLRVQIPAAGDQLPRAVTHWPQVSLTLSVKQEYGTVGRMRTKVPSRGKGREEGKKKKAAFCSLKKSLRRNEFLQQRKGKGKEIVDFWPDHTRGTAGKIWHTKT